MIEKRVLMDEGILEALIKANAIDKATGLTIEKLIELTGRDLSTVVLFTQLLLREKKVHVSNVDRLNRNGHDVWPAGSGISVSGEELAKAQREWRVRNHYPILVWLGPVVLKELEEKKKADELNAALIAAATRSTVTVLGDNPGQIAVGNESRQEQQGGGQSFQVRESIDSRVQDSSLTGTGKRNASEEKTTITTASGPRRKLRSNVTKLSIGLVSGLLVLILWEQIRHLF